jgi:hypothetical protein
MQKKCEAFSRRVILSGDRLYKANRCFVSHSRHLCWVVMRPHTEATDSDMLKQASCCANHMRGAVTYRSAASYPLME